MVVILVLLTFGICALIDFLTKQKPTLPTPIWIQSDDIFQKTLGFEHRIAGYRIRDGVAFHPGHLWVKPEGDHRARIGIDDFVCRLQAPITNLTWDTSETLVQGAPFLNLYTHQSSVCLLAPIGGKIIASNPVCMQHPEQISKDPFCAWLFIIENENFTTEYHNLIQGNWIFSWVKQEAVQLQLRTRQGLQIDDFFLNTFFGAQPCSGH